MKILIHPTFQSMINAKLSQRRFWPCHATIGCGGYPLNCLDEPVFMAVPKPTLTEFGIHCKLESCEEIFQAILDNSLFIRVQAEN